MNTTDQTGFRAGYAALIGAPNVGKSTLLNTLVGEKLAIVTPKPQTTRHRIFGIVTRPTVQLVIQDTPGYLDPEYLLHSKMMAMARKSMEDADVVLLLIDGSAPRLPKINDGLLQDLERFRFKPLHLVFNKTDLATGETLNSLIREAEDRFPARVGSHRVSAKTGDGTEALFEALVPALPFHPPFYPEDELSTQHLRFFAAELIREKIFLQYEKEIPYSSAVQVVTYTERPDGLDEIHAEIVVERDTQKQIIIGRGGSAIKNLGTAARLDIEQLTGRRVFLKLFVKVRDSWRRNPGFIRDFGYDS